MKTLNKFKDSRGFTLVELLIAVCVMAIAFAGLATMQIACINGNSIASNVTTGMTLAQDKMEELKSLNPDHPDLADSNPGNNGNLRQSIGSDDIDHREDHVNIKGESNQTAPDSNYGAYTRIWNVADDTPFSGRKTIVVIVTWGSGPKSIAVSTVI